MDANFGPDVTDEGAGKSEPSKNKVVVAAVALGALVGLGLGVGAFGITAAVKDGSLFGASSEEALPPTTSQEPEPEKTPEPSLIRATETTTQSATPTTVTSTAVHDSGGSVRSSTSSRQSEVDTPSSRGGSSAERDEPAPSVVPQPVLRPKSTTPTTSPESNDDDADDKKSTSPTSTKTTGDSEESDDNGTTNTSAQSGEDKRDDEAKPAEKERTSEVPTKNTPSPSKPDYPSDATNAELEAQLRAATSPSTPNRERVSKFEQGDSAQPVINMMSGLTSGSVALTSWDFIGPVRVTEGRAETRMRINTPIPTERPAVFVWRDGEWKISREMTCELADAMLMQCPA